MMNTDQIVAQMGNAGMIPVFSHASIDVSIRVLDAAYAAGVRVFEFTNRTAEAAEVFQALKIHAAHYPDLLLGIGTIFTATDAEKFHLMGADFIVSPALVSEVAGYCNFNQLLWIPGCATVTEVFQAKSLGATLVKAFPGNLLGPGFVKAVLSVIPDIKLMPTGGVEPTRENLAAWFGAGVHCVGMGSQLINPKWISDNDMQRLQLSIQQSLELIQEVKP
ncbi:beta/alpha barrel domain-containing protein [Mongoliitalea daihaiensis]|uniref:bifunctional 4-hydroxy-2-oxoglutarate aldolase/2-dehydro-3-deoxy-phosphogluconate aldolase n=1 Tax=Mongoliitalea daihaiensis TaxID=2782006 RepID=UPI00293E2526|nr:bifunctional 4-hydroxy-2-oxoglutarate aldolase/2-dehydro-3-deoxy-phosphogluconate aldolase [Mongoliitalea daihaiensis]